MPNPAEVAEIRLGSVGGGATRVSDFESVYVELRIAEAYSNFRFTMAEREPVPTQWEKMQLKPLQNVTIYLAGKKALEGTIMVRQVAYDAKSHHVELIGVTQTWAASTSTVRTADNNFDGMNILQVAQKVLRPYPNNVIPVGNLDLQVFEKLQAEKGETIFAFLERLARVRGVVLGSDTRGNFLLIGQHTGSILQLAGGAFLTGERQNLEEGVNILKMQCVISFLGTRSDFRATGQKAGDDGSNGSAANQMVADAKGILPFRRYLEITAEQPVSKKAEMQSRVDWEAKWGNNNTVVEAHITVQGWLRDLQTLWLPGDPVYVYSPMCLLDNVLKIQTVTFRQDSKSGTTTTLLCVLPESLNDKRRDYKGLWFPTRRRPRTTFTRPRIIGPVADDLPPDPSKEPAPLDPRKDPTSGVDPDPVPSEDPVPVDPQPDDSEFPPIRDDF